MRIQSQRLFVSAILATLTVVSTACADDTPAPSVETSLQRAAELLAEGKPDAALQTLTNVERTEPKNPWLWFLRGRAHHKLGEPYLAMESFDRALDELASSTAPDEALSDQIRAERRAARREVHSLSLRAGFAYDSNVTYTGGGVSLVSGQRDYKAFTGVSWDFAPVATRDEAVVVGLRLADSWYTDIDEFDDQEYGGYARYVRNLPDDWRFEIQYDYDLSLLGRDGFLSDHSFTPRFVYRWPAPTIPAPRDSEASASPSSRATPLETSFDYRVEFQDFLYSTRREFDRDSVTSSFGLEQSARVRPFTDVNWYWDVSAGYHFTLVPTEGSEFDRVTHDFSFELVLPINGLLVARHPASLRLSAEWELDDYANGSLYDIQRRERRDLLTTLGLIFSQTLVDNGKDGEVVLHAIFQWTDADSNIRDQERGQPFTYEKTVAGVQLEWRF